MSHPERHLLRHAASSRPCHSACAKRHLGVSYATAWRDNHKLLEAIRQRESRRLLLRRGVRRRRGTRRCARRQAQSRLGEQVTVHGRPSSSLRSATRYTCASIADNTGPTFAAWAKSALHPTAHLVSDGLASFNPVGAEVAPHGVISLGNHNFRDLEPFRWANTFISNLKTASAVTYPISTSPPRSRRGTVPRQPSLRPGLIGRQARTHLPAHRAFPEALAACCGDGGELSHRA